MGCSLRAAQQPEIKYITEVKYRQLDLDPSFKTSCETPADLKQGATVKDLIAKSVERNTYLSICRDRYDVLINLINEFNGAVK